jgi:hypothetical protein
VTTAKINDLAVTTAKILDDNITTAKINDLAVTGAKIATGAVTVAKKAAVNYTSVGSDGYSLTLYAGTSAALGSAATITTVGRPVLISLSSSNGISLGKTSTGFYVSGVAAILKLKRNGTEIMRSLIASSQVKFEVVNKLPLNYVVFLDVPSEGENIYTMELQVTGSANGYITISGFYIKAVEL